MDEKVRVSNLFTITVGSEDNHFFVLLQSPSEMTEYQFKELVDKIKEEEWKKLTENNKDRLVTASDNLIWAIVDRLKKECWFIEVSPINYYIYEFSYWDDKRKINNI